jgi:carboxyl-terminal processing protease
VVCLQIDHETTEETQVRTSHSRWRRFVAATAWTAAGFALGVAVVIVGPVLARPGASPYARLDSFAKVLSYIERSYVDPVEVGPLVDAAVKGMVDSLDPHSAYFTPEEYRALRREGEGDILGVGLEIGNRGRHITVIAPLDGSPADRAGLRSGDVLLAVDGESSRGWTLRDVVNALKGAPGTSVVLDVARPPKDAPDDLMRARELRFEVAREAIHLDAVESKLVGEGYGYVRIRRFQAGVAVDVEAAIEDLSDDAGGALPGLVLDLRNNPGGLLLEAIQVAEMFLSSGRIVSTRGRGGQLTDSYDATEATTLYDGPMVVLVDAGSASASEIVAAAIKENGRGELVGVRTFGKGSVQSIIELRGGAGLKLTTARYYTASGRSIQDLGIAPDVPVAGSLGDADKQLEAAVVRLGELGRRGGK